MYKAKGQTQQQIRSNELDIDLAELFFVPAAIYTLGKSVYEWVVGDIILSTNGLKQ